MLGQGQTSANNAITAAGLTVGTPGTDHSCRDAPGTVMLQSPGAGTQLAIGQPVTLTIESNTDPSGKLCTFK